MTIREREEAETPAGIQVLVPMAWTWVGALEMDRGGQARGTF